MKKIIPKCWLCGTTKELTYDRHLGVWVCHKCDMKVVIMG